MTGRDGKGTILRVVSRLQRPMRGRFKNAGFSEHPKKRTSFETDTSTFFANGKHVRRRLEKKRKTK